MKGEEKVKAKIDKKVILKKVMAIFIIAAMLLTTFSTFIYYIVANV